MFSAMIMRGESDLMPPSCRGGAGGHYKRGHYVTLTGNIFRYSCDINNGDDTSENK